MQALPDLEERFLEPENWQWHYFTRNQRKIRFGCIFPESTPKAVIVCLPGLSEFCEKYFETARNITANGYGFYVIDWMGQGKSGRYLPDPLKRHGSDFQNDIDDLHSLITNHIIPDNENTQLIMLGHSMGANIGMRYLQQHPATFKCATFSAPMFAIPPLSKVPKALQLLSTSIADKMASETYIESSPDWQENSRSKPGNDKFSSDPKRGAVHSAWFNAEPELQVGSVTYGWLYHAIRSCEQLSFETVQTPCLLVSAGREKIVDNKAIKKAAKSLPNAKYLDLRGSQHEILMERDEIREQFLEAFFDLIKETIA